MRDGFPLLFKSSSRTTQENSQVAVMAYRWKTPRNETQIPLPLTSRGAWLCQPEYTPKSTQAAHAKPGSWPKCLMTQAALLPLFPLGAPVYSLDCWRRSFLIWGPIVPKCIHRTSFLMMLSWAQNSQYQEGDFVRKEKPIFQETGGGSKGER